MSDDYETELRSELAEVRAQQTQLAERASRLAAILSQPTVTPVLCFWQHHSYCEEDAFSDTVDEAFGELDGMEECGTASTVGVRVGGYLLTWAEGRGEPRLPWDDDNRIRDDSDRRHRQMARSDS